MRSSAARRQPQLSLEELLHLRWLLGGGLALLSIWTLFYLEASIWPVAMLATGAIVLTALHPRLPGLVPRWLWRLGLPAVGGLFALDLLANDLIPAVVRLNVLLVLLRAVAYRTRREDRQLVVLCLFLIVITGILTVSMVFAVQILVFTALAMVFLFVVNLIDDAFGSEEPADAAWVNVSRLRLAVRFWQAIDLRIIVLSGVLFLTVVAVAGIIFMVIPRFPAGSTLSLMPFHRSQSLSGFSERIQLGEVTRITADRGIALRIDGPGSASIPADPYWRMVVLDEYERGALGASRSAEAGAAVQALPLMAYTPEWVVPGLREEEPPVGGGRLRVFLEGGISRHLPLPETFQHLQFREAQELVANRVVRTVATDKQAGTLLSYVIDGADFGGVFDDPGFAGSAPGAAGPEARTGSGRNEPLRQRFLDHATATLAVPVSPVGRGVLERTVATITGGEALDAETFALRACLHLARNHAYAVDVRVPELEGEDDPVIRWLAGGASGHCEFFAAAFTLLSRTAGHPTRAVAGFNGGDWNGYEDYFMVRNAHAHAWCEVYDGRRGRWFRVDPTPGGSIATGRPAARGVMPAVDRSFAAYADSVRMMWYRRVVGFDHDNQLRFLDRLRQAGTTTAFWGGILRDSLGAEWAGWRRSPWSMQNKGDVLALLGVVLLTAWLLRRWGVGSDDVFEWFKRGEAADRRRAGELLRRLRRRLEGSRRGNWDEVRAREVIDALEVIRFARRERWPELRPAFRAGRRLV